MTRTAINDVLVVTTNTAEQREAERALIEEARQRQRRRLRWIEVALVVVLIVAGVAYVAGRGGTGKAPRVATASSASGSNIIYSVGESIPATQLSGLQMLSAQVGIGITSFIPFEPAKWRGYLTHTNNGGSTWKVTGVFPKGFVPRLMAFINPSEGYVMGGNGSGGYVVLFTTNAGRNWSAVTTSKGPETMSARGDTVWIETQGCSPGMDGKCSKPLLDVYRYGSLVPSHVVPLPTTLPRLELVSSTTGFAVGGFKSNGENFNYGSLYVTTNDASTWRQVANPCEKGSITNATMSTTSTLFLYCLVGSPTSAMELAKLYSSTNGGATWQQHGGVTQNGMTLASNSTGTTLWEFNEKGQLLQSDNAGRSWTRVGEVSRPRIGNGYTDPIITTYGTTAAWYAELGHGIYRTLNGTKWTLIS